MLKIIHTKSGFRKNLRVDTLSVGQNASIVDTEYPVLEKLDSNGDIVSAITVNASNLTDGEQQSEINQWTMQGGLLKQIVSEGSILLGDDEEIILVASKSGYGEVMIGDNQEWAQFRFTTVPAITLSTSDVSTNVIITDTDANLCIYPSGSSVRIKNRLGSALVLRYSIKYSTV